MVIILHSVLLAWESQVDWNNLDDFPPVQRISYYNTIETDALSFVILVAWLKLLEYLSVFRQFSSLIVMFEMVACPLPWTDTRSCSWPSMPRTNIRALFACSQVLKGLVSFFALFLVVVVAFATARLDRSPVNVQHSYVEV